MSTANDAAGLTEASWCRHALDIRIRLAAAPYMVGWGYSVSSPRVAFESPGVPSSLVGGARLTNCSTLTASLLTSAFPDHPWTEREYGDLQVFADRLPESPWSPISAAVRMGVAKSTTDFHPRRWSLVQGWRSLGANPSGHAFLAFADSDSESLLVLEATSIDGIGPRYKTTTATALRESYPAGLYIGVLTRA